MLMPCRPLFQGLVAGALGAACSVYEVPSPGDADLSVSGAGGNSMSLAGGNGGNDHAGSVSAVQDATSGSDPESSAPASGGQGGTSDAQGNATQDAASDRVIGSDASGGPQLALPFAVDSYFRPTGYMGDGITPGPLVVQTSGCKLPRPAGAKGNCYKITYKPLPPEAGPAWSGLYWQYPDNNWGAMPGKRIAQGATKVSFYAASETGGDVVTFRVGGIQNAGAAHQDSLKVDLVQTLGTTLTQYSVNITGETYDEVLGPFAWVITTYDAAKGAAAATPIVFYLDDIRWE
jgi:hypothetical protein